MYYLGIDVGSVSAASALVDEEGGLVRGDHVRHFGEPEKALRRLLADYPLPEVAGYALCGVGAARFGVEGTRLDDTVALIEGVNSSLSGVRNILYIGGGSFSLTELDEEGRFVKNKTNSACASGTGAFLDQQALRLGIEPEELGRIAARHDGVAPPVATRCAVFAKTDMIHLQQEGFPIEAVAKGLCYGLGASTVEGLLGGSRLEGKTALVGGVALNELVVDAVREKLGVELVVPERPELIAAVGAARWALRNGSGASFRLDDLGKKRERERNKALRPPLELKLSRYPEFKYEDFTVDEAGTEIALLVRTRPGERFEVAMGIDIGSTSTKAALVERSGRAVAWAYRKTAGAPLEATQKVFNAFRSLQRKHGISFDIFGVGTTGSGRKMVGRVIGADLVLNEITAHARAALHIAPEVDTIIELGGQDAKFTQLSNGVVYNSVMNYVCAAGTGSFIEEQAQKLEVPIEKFADLAMGVAAPVTSDRCTVYMERDLDLLLATGWSKEEAAAAVLHSVRDNYLNKVVGGLHVGRRVMFQGATARNRALVAAFEQRLEIPISVSPLCHVTGAVGMALYVIERVRTPTNFRGLDFAEEKISIENEICELCRNRCRLSIIRFGGEVVAWGLKCGREYEDKRPKPKDVSGYKYVAARQRHLLFGPGKKPALGSRRSSFRYRIGLPRALSMYGYLPLWRTFFESLGCEVVVSDPTRAETLKTGEELVTAEFCAPLLVALGHGVELLAEKIDYVFFPFTIREKCPPGFTNAFFCCYVQAVPSLLRSFDRVRALGSERLLSPVLDFSDPKELEEGLYRGLRKPLGVSRRRVRRALEEGLKALAWFERENVRLGREALEKIRAEDGFGIVLIGRPYNTLDPGLNLDLPKKIAEMGYTVLFLDMLEVDPSLAADRYPNMYWHYGQRILSTARYVAGHPNLFPVYFTSFSCGPDSYVLTYFKEILAEAGKPYLILQFDGHGADAGYLTRIEAALESFHAWFETRRARESAVPVESGVLC